MDQEIINSLPPLLPGGRIIPDAFYTGREGAAFARLTGPQWRHFCEMANLRPIDVDGNEFFLGLSIVRAMNRAESAV